MNARELLAHATARPWEGSWPIDEGGAVLTQGGYFPVGKTTIGADAALIVQAVNEYDALLDLETAFRAFAAEADQYGLDAYGAHALLARLDEIRGQQ